LSEGRLGPDQILGFSTAGVGTLGISDSPAPGDGGAGIGGFGDVGFAGVGGAGVVLAGGGVVVSSGWVDGVEGVGGFAGGLGADSVAGVPYFEGATIAWPELIGVS
jgi:hypothetical protein